MMMAQKFNLRPSFQLHAMSDSAEVTNLTGRDNIHTQLQKV